MRPQDRGELTPGNWRVLLSWRNVDVGSWNFYFFFFSFSFFLFIFFPIETSRLSFSVHREDAYALCALAHVSTAEKRLRLIEFALRRENSVAALLQTNHTVSVYVYAYVFEIDRKPAKHDEYFKLREAFDLSYFYSKLFRKLTFRTRTCTTVAVVAVVVMVVRLNRYWQMLMSF